MTEQSSFLAELNSEQRRTLENRLLDRQSGKCFICNKPLDLVLHAGQLDIDHIDPLVHEGRDEERERPIYGSRGGWLSSMNCKKSRGSQENEEQILAMSFDDTAVRNQV